MGNYRLFLAGQLLSVSGTWTQRVAQDWLVLDLTNGSGVALGLVSAIQYTPMMLLSSWGGLLADRYSKRLLLIITQSVLALAAAALGVLALTGQLTLTDVYVLAGVMGVAAAVDNPTRQSFLIELVGRDRLPAAVGLNSATFNVSRMIGPAIGGALIVLVGAGPAFLVNAASFLAVIVSVALMRRESLFVEPPTLRSRGQIRAGWSYIVRDRRVGATLGLVFVTSTFAMNWPVLLALSARSRYDTGAQGYGVLLTALAAGSMAGALVSAWRGRPRFSYLVLVTALFAITEVASALMPSYGWFVATLVPLGFLALSINTTANSLIQVVTPYELRGRVMSAFVIATAGGTPLGGPVLGYLSEQFGPAAALASGGLASAVVTCAAAIRVRRTLRTEQKTADSPEPDDTRGSPGDLG
ncbi:MULTISPECIES: MFS transporter [Arthrobacter]|uniref:MFS transporter n=1 Tax=Arthrobacter TaxID=1663 RepID=UPI0022A7CB23|nr:MULTISPECIES: MFS transporter [Arthrobacter]